MVQLPDTKPSLAHLQANYDPAKAHEYYLRMRKLHPRQGAAVQPTSNFRRLPAHPLTPSRVKARQEAAAAVASLQKKLSELNQALKAALKKEAAAKKAATKKKGPLTAADKSKKARESKQYRQKHKQQLKTKAKDTSSTSGGSNSTAKTLSTTTASGTGSSKEIKAAIAGVRDALAAAKARQRALG